MKRTVSLLSVVVLAGGTACAVSGSQLARLRTPLLTTSRTAQAAPSGDPAAPQAATKAPQWKSRAEYDAFVVIQKASSPEAKITAANAFLAKYPNSDFKSYAVMAEWQAYVQMKNVHGAVGAAKSVLKDNANDAFKVTALNYLAFIFPYTYKAGDPDASSQVSQAESQAKEGLELLQHVQKPANASTSFDAQLKQYRADFNRALGFAALEQKDYSTAINYLKAAEQDNPKDSYTLSFLGEAYLFSKPPDYNDALW
ncbi:MAG TPA: hypothetical protein VMI06_14805, partial [Terriglobia bacterium]|nr:hypothetical protein [Terriglobia bacterium]